MSRELVDSANQDCFVVLEELHAAQERCTRHAHGFLDVGAIFFHDLARILTGFVLRRREAADGALPPGARAAPPLIRFPYVGYQDVLNRVRSDGKDFHAGLPVLGRRARLARGLAHGGSLMRRRRGRTLILGNPAVDALTLTRRLLSSGYRMAVSTSAPTPVPDASPQIEEVLSAVERLFARLGIQEDPRELQAILRGHMLAHVVDGDPGGLAADAVVSGTLLGLRERLVAACARTAGVPVLGVMHGEQFGSYDEPHIGYGEMTFASAIVGYGSAEAIELGRMRYADSLFAQPQYLAADSDLVRTNLGREIIDPLGSLRAPRVMYVPTTFSGQRRWGPFRDIPDSFYATWQRAVLEAFPGALYKVHPKTVVHHREFGIRSSSVVAGRLQDDMDAADVFVFDCVSSAFATAAATSKPIVYADIGFRRLSERGKKLVKERCLWVEANPMETSAEDLRAAVDALSGQSRMNRFSGAFSLSQADPPASRLDTVLASVEALLAAETPPVSQ